MEDLMLRFFEVTLSSSLLIVALLLASVLLRHRYRARLRVWLWQVVALRLLLPFSLTLAPQPLRVTVPGGLAQPFLGAPVLPDPAAEVGAMGGQAGVVGTGSGFSLTVFGLLAAVWVAGILVLLAYHIGDNVAFMRRARRFSQPAPAGATLLLQETARRLGMTKTPRLLVCPLVQSAMLAGFRRPLLLLPQKAFGEGELRFIFHHELVHHRRRDIWAKTLLLCAALLHWYNPLAWVMLHRAGADIELACDEAVVQDTAGIQRAAYGQVILDGMAAGQAQSPALSTRFSSSKKLAKRRLAGVFDQRAKRRGALVLVCFAVVAALAGSLVACAPENAAPSAAPSTAPSSTSINPAEQGGGSQTAAPAHQEMETQESGGQTWYIVENEAQLRSINASDETLSRHYIQSDHITLTGEWQPIGSGEHPFTGVYSGNGCHIRGLSVKSPQAETAGLFGVVENGTVYNVTLIRPDVGQSGAVSMAPLVALALDSHVSDNLVLTGEKPAGATGEVVTWDSGRVRLYEDGSPYIKDNFTNHTGRAIQGYSYSMLAFDTEGTPLKVQWGLAMNDDEPAYENVCEIDTDRGPESAYYVAPGETFDVRGGWSIFDEVDENGDCPVAYVLLCFRDITFADGTTWNNPEYAAWQAQYSGKATDVEALQTYYPFSQPVA